MIHLRLTTLACALGAALLATGCAQQPPQVRAEPNSLDAARAPMLQSSREAVAQLVDRLDIVGIRNCDNNLSFKIGDRNN